MQFETETAPISCHIGTFIVAGWTGRDAKAVQHHIDELAALGVPAPSATPLFYRLGTSLLCQPNRIDVLGEDTSGEAEPFIVRTDGKLWLGLGSDHTDRRLEAVSVAASKQVCPKPVAKKLWSFESVADRLDELILTSEILEDDDWVPYQSGTLASIKPLADLVVASDLPENAAMMCGTLPAIGGVRPSRHFRAKLEDPITGETILLDYETVALPIVA
ncbi:MAG: DUF2848 domain-containing protein [Loktanella sp.]|nr:DUF2848 domain-containing protein [Loktanella sp.]